MILTFVNKNDSGNGVVNLSSKQRLRFQTLLRLTGPSLASKANVTLRNDQLQPDATEITVPAGSAAVLTCVPA